MPDDFITLEAEGVQECVVDVDKLSIFQMADVDGIEIHLEGRAVAFFADPQLFGHLSQPLLGLLALGDVLDRAFKADQLSLGIAHAAAIEHDPKGAAVLALEPALAAPNEPLLFDLPREAGALLRVCPKIVSRVCDSGDELLRRA